MYAEGGLSALLTLYCQINLWQETGTPDVPALTGAEPFVPETLMGRFFY
jgi:hypothetical protein